MAEDTKDILLRLKRHAAMLHETAEYYLLYWEVVHKAWMESKEKYLTRQRDGSGIRAGVGNPTASAAVAEMEFESKFPYPLWLDVVKEYLDNLQDYDRVFVQLRREASTAQKDIRLTWVEYVYRYWEPRLLGKGLLPRSLPKVTQLRERWRKVVDEVVMFYLCVAAKEKL